MHERQVDRERGGQLMRLALLAAFAGTFALVACSNNTTPSSTFEDSPAASTATTTTETKSDSLPTSPAPATETPSTPPKEEGDAGATTPTTDAGASSDAGDEWWKDCLPFVPCFPPDER